MPLPAPSICQGFLTADTNDDATDRESAVLMYYLKLATDPVLPFFRKLRNGIVRLWATIVAFVVCALPFSQLWTGQGLQD